MRLYYDENHSLICVYRDLLLNPNTKTRVLVIQVVHRNQHVSGHAMINHLHNGLDKCIQSAFNTRYLCYKKRGLFKEFSKY